MKNEPENNGKRRAREFPRVTLEEALRVCVAIKEKNAGNPWPPEDVARGMNLGPKTGRFFYLTAGARDYGLTKGIKTSEKIELTPLGKAAVYPASPQGEQAAKVSAFTHVELFRKVLQHYRGDNLPEMTYLSNTLKKEFDIPEDQHQEFVDLFRKNCRFLSIGQTVSAEIGAVLGAVPGSAALAVSPVITLAKPAQGSAPLCFVVMPFTEHDDRHPSGFFEEVLNSLIVPAAQAAGFEVRSANRKGSDVIQSTIINDLLKADLVVADLTEHNPNVLFELGMRMAEDKPVALIRAKGTGRIFDVDNMLRVYDYDPCIWPTTVARDKPQLVEHIKATWDNRANDLSYLKILRREPAQVEVVG